MKQPSSAPIQHRARRRLGFRDAVVLTAPLVILILYLVIASAVDYYHSLEFDDYWANATTVEGRFQSRLNLLLRLPRATVARQRLTPEAQDAGIINLQVDPASMDAMYDDPQLGWGVWSEGTLEQHGNLLPIKIRKRGDNSIHWLTEKRTLTVRTPRTDFYKRYRSFGLSTKTVLTSYVANRLAQEFDLLAPTTTVVPVFINNQYSGMYRFLETVDESFLRPFDRMPGNIFRGDAAERSDYFKGLPRDVFANPYIWDRVAANDRPTAAGSGQLRLFIEDINAEGFEAHQRLMRRIDQNEVARLISYLLLVGDPYHMDATHNQLWYEDPSTALLHPIPWDTRLLRLAAPPSQRVSAFLRAALRDPWLIDAVMSRIARELQTGTLLATADSLSRGMWTRYHEGFVYDSLRLGLVSPLGYPGEVHRVLAENARTLRQWLGDARAVVSSGQGQGNNVVMDLESRGYAGLDLLAIEGPAGISSVRMDQNQNGELDPEDPAVPGGWDASSGSFLLTQPIPLLAAWRTDTPGIHTGSQHYRFFVTGASPSEIHPVLRNRYTGDPVTAGEWPPSSSIEPDISFSPWQYSAKPSRLYHWSGTVRLTDDVRIATSDTLVIDPGTTILMNPDVSIVSRGRVRAEGSASRPITFTRADHERPWGAFSLQGHGADSSVFRYVTWEWGGGDLVDRIEYTGMVNLHRVSGVVVEHSIFRDNVRSDDTFHALHSNFILRESQFVRANSDAVDLDISSGTIEGNTLIDTGGDAIDLMTSAPLIWGNRMVRSGDKGISVGEASNPVIFANDIENCRRGIEIKDRSAPIALNNTLVGNGVGIYTDRKNWRYGGGGFGTFINNTLRDNGTSLSLDVFSRITLANTSGLDSVMQDVNHRPASAVGLAELSGFYRQIGIDLGGSAGENLADAHMMTPVPPIASARFEEDFVSIDDGWRGGGGVERVEKTNLTLHATAEVRPGMMGRKVDWDLRQSGPATLMLQVAASDIDSASVTVTSPQGNVTRSIELSGNPAIFRLVTVALPARHYTAIVISMTPHPRVEKLVKKTGWIELKPGQLWLRGYDLFSGSSTPAVASTPGS